MTAVEARPSPRTGPRSDGGCAAQEITEAQGRRSHYIRTDGEDLPEVRHWTWEG